MSLALSPAAEALAAALAYACTPAQALSERCSINIGRLSEWLTLYRCQKSSWTANRLLKKKPRPYWRTGTSPDQRTLSELGSGTVGHVHTGITRTEARHGTPGSTTTVGSLHLHSSGPSPPWRRPWRRRCSRRPRRTPAARGPSPSACSSRTPATTQSADVSHAAQRS